MIVGHDEFVLVGLLTRIGDHLDRRAGHLDDKGGEIPDPTALGHLVQDLDPLAARRRVLQRQFDAADRVLNVDEGPGLAAGAVDRQRIADRRLHQKPVQHRAVVAVIVEPVDQPLVHTGLLGLCAPDDALMQVGDPKPVVAGVELEQQGVLRLGHVIDRARVGREQDFLLGRAVVGLDRDLQIALGDLQSCGAVAIDAHGAEVRQMDVATALDDGGQQVVGGVDVVVDGVELVPRRLHRIGSRPLFGEVNHAVGLLAVDQGDQPVELLAHGHVDEADGLTGQFLPGRDALAHGPDRRQRLDLQFVVDVAAAEVVDDHDIPAMRRKVQGRGPAAKPVAAQNQHLHITPPFLPCPTLPRPCRRQGQSGQDRAAATGGGDGAQGRVSPVSEKRRKAGFWRHRTLASVSPVTRDLRRSGA